MVDMDKKLLEKFDADFHKISSKEMWEPCDITLMKDLQKLMYYIEVRAAMKDGDRQYPGYEYIEDDMSYRGRDSMGRFTSGRMHGRYYDDMNSSGRRYYDSEKDNVANYLHRMMDSENRPEMKNAMQAVLRELEAK